MDEKKFVWNAPIRIDVLAHHLPARAEENTENFGQGTAMWKWKPSVTTTFIIFFFATCFPICGKPSSSDVENL